MKNFKTEIKWAIIFALIGLLWMFFEKAMGWHGENIADHPKYTMLFMIPAILVYVLALRDKKKSLGGQMTWKQGFISGLVIGGIVALLTPLTTYITHAFITPDYFENAIAYGVETG